MDEKVKIRNTVIAVLGLIILVVLGFIWRMNQAVILSNEELRINGAILFDKPRIFSDFELQDHRGQPFNKSNLQGIWTIVFFGFSHCPDVCPTTLAVLNDTYSKLKDSEKERLQVVMISVDPERDTVEKLADYVPYFNAEFTGVTGDDSVIGQLTSELHFAYYQVP